MNCREFELNMSAYIDGSLPADEYKKMESHKAGCAECAKLVRIQKLISASLVNVEPVKAPTGLADRILKAVEQNVPENVIELTPDMLPDASPTREKSRSFGCETFGEHAAAFADGSLEAERRAEMERHLGSCPLCARVVRMHTVVLSALNSAKPVPVPEGMAERVVALTAEHDRVHGWKRIGALAAFTAVSGLIATTLLKVTDQFAGRTLVTLAVFENIRESFIDALSMITAFKDTTIAWLALYMPTLPDKLALLSEPVSIPFTTYSVPAYFLAAFALLSVTAWKYFNTPVDYAPADRIA